MRRLNVFKPLKKLKVAQYGLLIFFNPNSLMDRFYHTLSFVSLKMV